MLDLVDAGRAIYQALDLALCTDEPLLVGRNGSTELETMLGFIPPAQNTILLECAGIWNNFESWMEAAKVATLSADIYAGFWYSLVADKEKQWLKDTTSIKVPLTALESYYVERPLRWTRLLIGQRVAIVSPFANTCVSQYACRKAIWGDEADTVLPPNMTLLPVQTGFAPRIAAGRMEWPAHVTNWSQAVDHVVTEVHSQSPRVVLIGCGGLGMLIATRLKAMGYICIVVGGALQVYFGIKGRRWADTQVAEFWNDAWTIPPEAESPRDPNMIEGGCYWAP